MNKLIEGMREVGGYWYLASPYSKYPGGLEEAFKDVCKVAAWCVQNHIRVYCPIAHTHPVAMYGGIDPLSHDIWLPVDTPLMHGACGIAVCMMPTWEQSYGIQHEIEVFKEMNKPIGYIPYPIVETKEETA